MDALCDRGCVCGRGEGKKQDWAKTGAYERQKGRRTGSEGWS